MAKQTINLGTGPNTGTGEPIRTAFGKVNENFTEVYDIAQSAFDYANTIVSDTQIDPLARSTANSAFDAANSASTLAQNAYDYANTIVSDTQIDPLARSTANAAYDAANSSSTLAQAAYDYANTIVSDTQVDPLARSTANSAWSTANAAFDQANTGGNPFDQDLNTSNNVTFNEVTASNVIVESIALKANTLLAGDESKILSIPNSSGDGEGYTTLRLIPDDTIESFDQYLIIDPTQPTHIHIRAGGTQDDSNADLFLGGENSHFVVYAGLDPAVAISANNNTWAFNVDGTIQFPDSSTQTTAFTSNPTLDFTTTNALKIEKGVQESYSSIANATSTVVHNCANGHIFYHTTPSSNWTANFTNLLLENGYATNLTLVISQGATGYIANSVLIDSSVTTIKWQANTVPTPNVNSTDVLSFSVLKTGPNNGDVIVLGQLTSFG